MILKAGKNSGDDGRVVEIWAEQDCDEIVILMKDSGSNDPTREWLLLRIRETSNGQIMVTSDGGLRGTCIDADEIKDIIV